MLQDLGTVALLLTTALGAIPICEIAGGFKREEIFAK
jgi:hypothetical protein